MEPKTDASRRTIAVPAFVLQALADQKDSQRDIPANVLQLVFTTPRGTPHDPRNVSCEFHHDLQAVGLPTMRLHDLRHIAASMVLAEGASLVDVMRMLGHTSIAVTIDTYGHLVEGRSRELADVMDRLLG